MILYKGYRYAVETIHGRVHIAPRRSGLVWNSPRCLNFRHLLSFGYQVADIVHLAARVPTKPHSFLQRTSGELVQTPDALTFCDPPPPIPSGQYLSIPSGYRFDFSPVPFFRYKQHTPVGEAWALRSKPVISDPRNRPNPVAISSCRRSQPV